MFYTRASGGRNTEEVISGGCKEVSRGVNRKEFRVRKQLGALEVMRLLHE
jgi:hypothetical protein